LTINVYDPKGSKILTRSVTGNMPYAIIDIQISQPHATGIYIVEVVNSLGLKIAGKRVIVVK